MADLKEDKQKIIDWTFPTNEKSVEFERHFHKWYNLMLSLNDQEQNKFIKKLMSEPQRIVLEVEKYLNYKIKPIESESIQMAALLKEKIHFARKINEQIFFN